MSIAAAREAVVATPPTPPAPREGYRCQFCESDAPPRSHRAREMMNGSREPFDYFECVGCGSLQIAEIPDDLGRFYAGDYYSFAGGADDPDADGRPIKQRLKLRLKRSLMRRRARAGVTGRGLVGRLLLRRQAEWHYFDWFARAGVTFGDRVLEVGSGAGDMLHRLYDDGFRHLTGVDPFVGRDLTFRNGVRVLRRTLGEVEGPFDLVLIKHAFEHMPDPLGVLRRAGELLRPGGNLIVEQPVAGTHAWRTYGRDWVQLDPPRHLHVASVAGMRRLVGRAGLEWIEAMFDSGPLQFYGSEQYRRDVPLRHPDSHWLGGGGRVFSGEQMRAWAAEARALNRAGDGDTAAYLLRRPAA